jgi:hypothetical protein
MGNAKILAGMLSNGPAISNIDTLSSSEYILVSGKAPSENRAYNILIGKNFNKAMVKEILLSEIV